VVMEQPDELREYLSEGEAIVREWFSRGGMGAAHDRNLEHLATLLCLNVVIEQERPFAELRDAAVLYLTAAFQMGRACGDDCSVG